MVLRCTVPLCLFSSSSIALFCRHINNHFKEKSENCNLFLCPRCTQGFTTGRYWLRHYERTHAVKQSTSQSHKEKGRQSLEESPSISTHCQEEAEVETEAWCLDDQGEKGSTAKTEESSREKIARFLLRLQCEHGMSRAATSFVASEIGEIVDTALKEQNESRASKSSSVKQACEEFASEYKLSKFCHEELCYIAPTTQILTTGGGEFQSSYQYVDVKKQLTSLLENGRLENCKRDRLVKLVLYFDEFGVCNPLRKKASDYSLGGCYFAVDEGLSMSVLSDIHLLLLCPTKLIKLHGLNTVMKPVTDSLCDLLNNGLDTCDTHFDIKVEFVCGDNLGVHKMAGFQESFSSGQRPCRTCHATNEDFGTKLTEQELTLRTEEEYQEELNMCENGDDEESRKAFGIKSKCVFDELKDFKVTEMFPPDIAHDLFESGVVNHSLALVLSYLIFQIKLFTFASVQKAMKSFSYARVDKANTPPMLQAKGRKVLVKGTFSQCWTFLRVLPFMIGPLVPPDQKAWLLVTGLLSLVQLICAPRMDGEILARMQPSVEQWLREFCGMFPDFKIKPKFHYLLHYRHWAAQIGSLRKSWTMRFEAKHQQFKIYASRAHNTKNICKTLAVRHQEAVAACEGKQKKMMGKKCKPCLVTGAFGWEVDDRATYTKMAVLAGQKYCVDDVLIVRNPAASSSESCDLLLRVAYFQFDAVNHVKIIGDVLRALSFDGHYMAYRVTKGEMMMIPSAWIFDPTPLATYSVQTAKYVPLRYQIPGLRITSER